MTSDDKNFERRQRILNAAAIIFERDGINKASMRNIAKEAGVTTGAIYPYFDGKEMLYAALLEESLQQLYEFVITSHDPTAPPLDALLASATAFYVYYTTNEFEANLGVYLYGMGQIRSLGRERDQALNDQLLQTLNIFSASLDALAPNTLQSAEKANWVRAERDTIFTMLLGILTMSSSGRAKSIGTTPHDLLNHYLSILKERYG